MAHPAHPTQGRRAWSRQTTDYGRPVRKWPSLHSRKSIPTPRFLGTAEAYFVCHIDPNFQIIWFMPSLCVGSPWDRQSSVCLQSTVVTTEPPKKKSKKASPQTPPYNPINPSKSLKKSPFCQAVCICLYWSKKFYENFPICKKLTLCTARVISNQPWQLTVAKINKVFLARISNWNLLANDVFRDKCATFCNFHIRGRLLQLPGLLNRLKPKSL